MSTLFEPVNVGLSPNARIEDLVLAAKLLLSPWRWQQGSYQDKLTKALAQELNGEVFLFASGREALWALFQALGLRKNDEVLIQAFTCAAVPNAIRWAGGKPVFVDIDPETFNLDPKDLQKKISPRAKAVIVQHTFGIPADGKTINQIARKFNLMVIEDCAHALGSQTETLEVLGRLGDVTMLSFGRDKVLSSVWGGGLVVRHQDLIKRLKKTTFPQPPFWWTGQQLLHPLLFLTLILPLYCLELGKVILILFQKLKLLSVPVSTKEKQGKNPWSTPRRMPDALACLALRQFSCLNPFVTHRQELAKIYFSELKDLNQIRLPKLNPEKVALLRVPARAKDAGELWLYTKQRCILLGRWYSEIIDPRGTNRQKLGYREGSCPRAERLAQEIINLPCSPRTSRADVLKVCSVVREFYGNR